MVLLLEIFVGHLSDFPSIPGLSLCGSFAISEGAPPSLARGPNSNALSMPVVFSPLSNIEVPVAVCLASEAVAALVVESASVG